MPVRKCSSCGAEWTSSLVRCPLCGGEATQREGPTGKIVLKTAGAAKKEEESAVDLAAEIRKELSDLPPMEAPPAEAQAIQESEARRRALPDAPKPEPPPVEIQKKPPPPAAPAKPPSNALPIALALLSFLGCAILPLTLFYDHAKLLGLAVPKLGYAAAGLFALLAPFAWLRARTRATQLLGMLATFGYVASFATIMILEAILRWTR